MNKKNNKAINESYDHARVELDLLKKRVKEPIVDQFEDEICALVNAFYDSEQCVGAVDYVVSAINQTIYKLCKCEPLTPIEKDENNWGEPFSSHMTNHKICQNKRLYSLFKENDKAYNINAIVWQGTFDGESKNKYTFQGVVYKDLHTLAPISSAQYIKYPFIPKTFTIDVISVSYDDLKKLGIKDEVLKNLEWKYQGLHRWTYVVRDIDDLKPVYEYYDHEDNNQ